MARIILTVFLFLATAASAGGYFYLNNQINIGAQKIAEGTSRIQAGEKQIRDGQAKLNAGKQKLSAGKQQLAKGKKTYKAMKAIPYNQLSQEMPKASPLIKMVEYKVAEGGQKIKEGEAQVAHGAQLIAAGQKKLADGKKRLAVGKAALQKGKEKLVYAEKIRHGLGLSAIVLGVLFLISLLFCFRKKNTLKKK